MKLFDDLYAGAMWDVGVAINRSNSLPLDKYAIFPSKALADAYASHNATAIRDQLIVEGLLDKASDKVANDLVKAKFNNNSYAGQIVAVVTETATTVYYIGADNLLHEVGAKINVNEEIEVDNVGIKKDEDGKLYVDLEALGGLTEEDVLGLIAASNHATAMVVDSVNLETDKYVVNEVEYDAVANVIYYVKDAAAAGEDVYKEYLLIGEELTLIGSTSTDLSNYYTKSEVDDLIKDFITADDLPEIPDITVAGNKDSAEDGEVMLLADIAVDETDKHKLNRTYAAAATKEYVDGAIGAIEIPKIELENLEGEIETTEDTVKVIALQDLDVDEGGHKISYQDVEVASKAGLNAVKDRVADLEATEIVISDEENAPQSTADEIAVLVGAIADGHEITLDYDLAVRKSYVDSEIGRVESLIPSIPDLSLDTEEAPTAEEGEIVVLSNLTVSGHEITRSYEKAATKASVDAVADRIKDIEDLKIGDTYATKDELKAHSDTAAQTYATIENLGKVSDKVKAIEDLKIDETYAKIGDSYLKNEIYTKTETDAAITAKIGEMTGGESAADVKLMLNDYRKANDTEIYGADLVRSWTLTDGDGKETYTPDYTKESRLDAVETKVSGIEEGAQVNKIEKIKVNGVNQSISADKSVNLAINLNKIESTHVSVTATDIIGDSSWEGYAVIADSSNNDATYLGANRKIKVYHTSDFDGDTTGYTVEGTIATLEEVDQKVANAVKWTEM